MPDPVFFLKPDRAHALTLAAAEETRARIRRDRERLPVQLRPLLDEIDEKLLHPDLRIEPLMRSKKLEPRSASSRFTEELDLSPWAYVTDCRMEVAARLLRGTDLKIRPIALNVAYPSTGSFRRAFKKWSGGLTPTAYRREQAARASGEPGTRSLLAAGIAADLEGLEEIARGVSGEAEPEEAVAALQALQIAQARIYNNYWIIDPPTEVEARAELAMARGSWRILEELPREEWAAAVESQAGCRTAAFFHQLCARSYEIGAEDPARGLEIARLAPIALVGLAPQLDEPLLKSYRARASVVAAHALRLAGDRDGAAEAFAAAERELAAAGDGALLLVVHELSFRKAQFLASEGDFEGTLRLIRTTRDVHREIGERLQEEGVFDLVEP